MDEQFFCKQVQPREATYDDCLEIAEVLCRGFEKDGIMEYVRGPLYAPNPSYSVVLQQGIRDPRQRLNEMIAWSKRYRILIHSWARYIHNLLLNRGNDIYVAVDAETEKPVGLACWVYPAHMVADLEKELGRTGVFWKIYAFCTKLKYSVCDFFLKLGGNHPVKNERALRMYKERTETVDPKTTVDDMAKLSSSELADAKYPLSSMIYCHFFAISPDYHRLGLGQKLMNYSLANIPSVPTPFSSTLSGPQKLYLEASPSGFGMYKKTGWTYSGISVVPTYLPPHECDNHLMFYTR